MVSDDSLRPRRAMPVDGELADPTTGEVTAELPDSSGDTAAADQIGRHRAVDHEPAMGDQSFGHDPGAPAAHGHLSVTDPLNSEETPITASTASPSSADRHDEVDSDLPHEASDSDDNPLDEFGIAVEHAPFMRPGTVPEEVLTAATASSPTEPDVPSEPAPAPLTSQTPTDAPVDATVDDAANAAEPTDESDEDEISAGPARRRGFGVGAKVAVGVLIPALAAGAFFGVRQVSKKDEVVVTETSSASAKTPTPTPTPAFGSAALISAADATAAFGNAGWKVAHTWDTVTAADDGITCMSALPAQPAPALTKQQSLTSTAQGATALLHRIDAFATPEAAQQAYGQRLAELAACDDVPALIASAAAITGVGDQSFSMTITFEDATANVQHTVLLARSGVTVSMTDVANLSTPITPDKVAVATGASMARLCQTSAGKCPAGPKATVVAIPKTPLEGWLAQSDIPRVTKGNGMWSPTDPVNVTSVGSQCEDLTLATAEGPLARKQRSYLLTQDELAPANFGVDQVEFAFKDEAGATTFATKLIDNISACGTRTETAEITDQQNVRITGEGGIVVAGRVWKVTQNIEGSDPVSYRVGVMRAGGKVTYLISNTTETFDFTREAWIQVAARAGQRVTQA